jgi:ornithine decarboxylase
VTSQFQSLDSFSSLQIFAHPSNFLVDSAFSLATKVIGKRVSRTSGNISYVINDGIFGAFGRLLHEDDLIMEPKSLYKNASDQVTTCDVYGPSGHDMDQVEIIFKELL